jgi:cardiolipin synthase
MPGDTTMLSDLYAWHWISLHGLVTILALGIYLAASHFLRQRRHPSAAIAWFISLALIPYLALPLYLLLGNRKVPRGLPGPRIQTLVDTDQRGRQAGSKLQILASTLALPPPSTYAQFELHEDGSHARQALIAVIDSAKSTLDLSTFVLGRDVLGQEIILHLIERAQKGVQVRLLIDGIGVYLAGHPNLRPLTTAGVRVVKFASPFKSPLLGRTNLRNHRKMVIADSDRVWMGGRNLAAEYFEGVRNFRHTKIPWIDLSFELSGAIAQQVQDQFNQDWNFAAQERQIEASKSPQTDLTIESSTVQLLPSGPDQTEDTVYTLLISSCFAAQTRILAVTPYFVPDATLQMALTLAARRGIVVDLILPFKSNHRLADMARHAALRDLTSSGARVWLVPEMIHAKAIVIDNEVALAGSVNLDERSLFLNYEVMVAFYKRGDVEKFAGWIQRRREGAQLYKTQPPGVIRELGEGMVRWLAFQL